MPTRLNRLAFGNTGVPAEPDLYSVACIARTSVSGNSALRHCLASEMPSGMVSLSAFTTYPD